MSYTTSAMLSRSQSSIAVAGATGKLGFVITETLLTTFKPFFSRVVALTRDASSEKARALAELGAQVAQVPLGDNEGTEESNVSQSELLKAFKNIDIVVNALGSTSLALQDAVAAAAIEAGAKVYFPSEFGVDHRLNDFPGFDSQEWIKKRKHFAYATDLAAKKGGDVKVIAIYIGAFLEYSINPWFGFDLKTRTATTFGPSNARVTYTSIPDIARSVAQLAILAMLSPASLADRVPPHVHIAGATASAAEIARILSAASPGAEFTVKEEDIAAVREKVKKESEKGKASVLDYLRIIMGEGKLDFSMDNVNELVNPNERLWKWKTIEQTAKELSGLGETTER